MTAVLLLFGLILVVAAVRGTQGVLFGALGQDVPAFFVWGAAVVAIVAIGYVPGLKVASRGLLALVIVVLILNNYKAIIAGFQNSNLAGQSSGSSSGGSGSSNAFTSILSGVTSSAFGSGASEQ